MLPFPLEIFGQAGVLFTAFGFDGDDFLRAERAGSAVLGLELGVTADGWNKGFRGGGGHGAPSIFR